MSTSQRLTTERLELRPIQADEVDELHGVFADYDVRYYLCDGNDFGREWVADVVSTSQELFADRGVGLWAARRSGAAAIAGVGGFYEFTGPGSLELLYALLPPHWGTGLATEMAQELVRAGIVRGVDPVRASVDAPNLASLRVLAHLGFEEVGREPAEPPRTKWEQVHHVLPARVVESLRGVNEERSG